MKTANLVIAIIYTAIYALLVLSSPEDNMMLLGVMILSGPVVLNWLSYAKWPNS